MRKGFGASLRVLGLAAFGVWIGGAAEAQVFTDWASVLKPSSTVTVNGVSQEFAYASGAAGVTSVEPPSTNLAVTFSETFDAQGRVTGLSANNGKRSVGFYTANGDSIASIAGGKLIYGLSSDWTRKALAADALGMGWKYQSFGVWVSGLGMAAGSMGSASVGAITPGTSVPQTGSASFTGFMGGIYNDASGQDHILGADMGLKVNFGAHYADFWTTNTSDHLGKRYADLDISGVFVSLPNHPALFGTLNTSRLTGTSSAQFYGPGAEEVGGVFTMTPKSGTGLERLAGAFGGKRGTPISPGEPAAPAIAPAFLSWGQNLKFGDGMVATGKAQELTFTTTAVSAPTPPIPASYTEVVTTSGYVNALKITTPTRTVGFSETNGDIIFLYRDDRRIALALDKAETQTAMVIAPEAMGWNYHSFGAWETLTDLGSGSAGVVSYGAATSGKAIPTTGSAVFNGVVGGLYNTPGGVDTMVLTDMTLNVDFASRSGAFVSSAMKNIFTGEVFSGTAVTGSLTYTAATNNLTGTLTTANGRLSGVGTGQFYGPAAEEVGGTFALTSASSTSLEGLVGAFGARR